MSQSSEQAIEVQGLIKEKTCPCSYCVSEQLKDSWDFDSVEDYIDYLQYIPTCRSCEDTGIVTQTNGIDDVGTEMCMCRLEW